MKGCLLLMVFCFLNVLAVAQKGPITGTLSLDRGYVSKKWGDTLVFNFKLKNAGTETLTIKEISGTCDCQDISPKGEQNIKAGASTTIKVLVTLDKEKLKDDLINGIISYDKSILVITNASKGVKEKYELSLFAEITIKK